MIPKIIHQVYWDFYGDNKDIPEVWRDFYLSWKKHFPEPEYKHILWDLEKSKKLLEEDYPWFLETFNEYPKHIQRADSIRYFALHKYGGIYADLDCEVRKNFYQFLDQDKINIVQSCYYDDKLMNCLMVSPQGDEKWKRVFDKLIQKKNVLNTIDSTGPKMISESLEMKEIKVLDYDNFNPLKRRSPVYGFFENTFSIPLDNNKSKNWDNAYVVHHGTESWREEEIKGYLNQWWVILLIICFIILSTYLILKRFK